MHRFALDFSNGSGLASQDNVKTEDWTKTKNWRVWWCSHFPLCPCYGRAAPAESPLPWTRRMRVFHRSLGPSPGKMRRPRPCNCLLYSSVVTTTKVTLKSDIRKLRGPAATAPWTAYRHQSCRPSWTSSWSKQDQRHYPSSGVTNRNKPSCDI